jgi:hypothetical protein
MKASDIKKLYDELLKKSKDPKSGIIYLGTTK